jgi:hypothetical protein
MTAITLEGIRAKLREHAEIEDPWPLHKDECEFLMARIAKADDLLLGSLSVHAQPCGCIRCNRIRAFLDNTSET